MFKVFRRDCLYALELNVIASTLILSCSSNSSARGAHPIELPVNYRSRSFKEGKKVRMFRDPLTWLGAIAWLRFANIDPMKVVEQMHCADQTGKSFGSAKDVNHKP